MRIVLTPGELLKLAWRSAVLDTDGRVWVSRERASNMRAGWYSFGVDPKSSIQLADGRPVLVLYDAGDPASTLWPVQQAVQRLEDLEIDSDSALELLPYRDFIVCWNKRHPTTPLEVPS